MGKSKEQKPKDGKSIDPEELVDEAIEELPMQTAVELHVTCDWGIR